MDFAPGIQVRVNSRIFLWWVICALCSSSPQKSVAQQAPSEGRVHAEMRNVVYHFTDSVTVHIAQLDGELVPTQAGGMPVFDDASSFTLSIRSGTISITTNALADVLNQYALAAADAPIKAIRVTADSGKLKIQGRLHAKGNLPFESEGSLSITRDGEIRVHTEKVRAEHVPVKGLMDLLGEPISKLIDTRKVRGIRAENDDLILTPSELFPPPHINGRLSRISIRGNEIVQEYGNPSAPRTKMRGNYMAYRGNRLRFGKLTMSDTDLTLIDLDPRDPLDFYLAHYQDQLVAGYTKSTPSFGLRSYFVDYNKLRKTKSSP